MHGGRRKTKTKKRVLITLSVLSLVAGICLLLFGVKYKTKERYEMNLQSLIQEKEEALTEVYVSKEALKKGDIIYEENTEKRSCLVSMSKDQYITSDDFGKVLLIDVEGDTQLIKNMLLEPIQEGLREVQCDEVFLSENLREFDYVDVRIALPNGEDYVVLSKKMVHELRQEELKSTCFLWLTEDEITNYSAAVVDANQYKGSSLYTTKYIEPTVQEATKVTYIPSYIALGLSFWQQGFIEAKQMAAEAWE